MTTRFLWLPTHLLTMHESIFTISRSMTKLLATVRTAFQLLATNQTAKHVRSPARLVFQSLLAAQASLLCQKRTLRTRFIIQMASMRNLRMTTRLWPVTGKGAWWWSCAAWQWCLQDRATTFARNIFEDCFVTTVARAFVAQVGTGMVAAFQTAPTNPCAYMFCLDSMVNKPGNKS